MDDLRDRLDAELAARTQQRSPEELAALFTTVRAGAKRRRVARVAGAAVVAVLFAVGLGSAALGFDLTPPDPAETDRVPELVPAPRISAAPEPSPSASEEPLDISAFADAAPGIDLVFDDNPLLPSAPYATAAIWEAVEKEWQLVPFAVGNADSARGQAAAAFYLADPQGNPYFAIELEPWMEFIEIERWRHEEREVVVHLHEGGFETYQFATINLETGEVEIDDLVNRTREFRGLAPDGREIWLAPRNNEEWPNVSFEMYDPATREYVPGNPFGYSLFQQPCCVDDLSGRPVNLEATPAAIAEFGTTWGGSAGWGTRLGYMKSIVWEGREQVLWLG